MTNPASALANLLTQWDVPPNKHPEQARAETCGQANGLDFWRTHAEAVALLRDIEREIAAMEVTGRKIEWAKPALAHWYRAVFAFTTPWSSVADINRPAVTNEAHLDLLRMLGELLEERGTAPAMTGADTNGIREALDQAEKLILASAALPPGIRGYLLALVAEARACLNDLDTYGTARLRNATFELNGAMHAQSVLIEETGSEEEAGRWKSLARKLLAWTTTTAATTAIQTATQAAQTGIDHMLTQ
jgi:hypothetical protein